MAIIDNGASKQQHLVIQSVKKSKNVVNMPILLGITAIGSGNVLGNYLNNK